MDSKDIDAAAEEIANRVITRVAFVQADLDMLVGEVIGAGAIPMKGRENRKAPCMCCLIDPKGPNEPKNRLCTTKGAIGTLNDQEEVDWCSKITVLANGRCARAKQIQTVAKECKTKYSGNVHGFFNCFAKAFETVEPARDIFAAAD